MPKDFLEQELNIGDEVVFITPGYRDFSKGPIIKITDKMVFIEKSSSWNNEIKQFFDQVIKIK